jgi:hypothetical protein
MGEHGIKSGGCQPAVGVVGRTLSSSVAGNALASAFAKPRGAYAPRSWLCCTVDACRKIATFAMHNRTFNQENIRRASARRGFVLRTLGCEDRRLCSDWRTPDQERRASARRGCGWANVVRNVVEAHLQSRLRNHGGLTPPAPALHGVCSPMKWRFLRYANAFSQERRVSARRGFVIRMLGCEDRRLCSDWRTSDQERRASARRGCGWANVVRNVVETHLQSRLRNHGGLTPPAPALLC